MVPGQAVDDVVFVCSDVRWHGSLIVSLCERGRVRWRLIHKCLLSFYLSSILCSDSQRLNICFIVFHISIICFSCNTLPSRRTLKNSRLVCKKDDVHVCIMCLRAIMNYQVSSAGLKHTYLTEAISILFPCLFTVFNLLCGGMSLLFILRLLFC